MHLLIGQHAETLIASRESLVACDLSRLHNESTYVLLVGSISSSVNGGRNRAVWTQWNGMVEWNTGMTFDTILIHIAGHDNTIVLG